MAIIEDEIDDFTAQKAIAETPGNKAVGGFFQFGEISNPAFQQMLGNKCYLLIPYFTNFCEGEGSLPFFEVLISILVAVCNSTLNLCNVFCV